MEKILKRALITNIILCILIAFVFNTYRTKQFMNPVLVDMNIGDDNSYFGKVNLIPARKYGVVVSAIFHQSYTKYFMNPRISIDGKIQRLIGGISMFSHNLGLNFHWTEGHHTSYQKHYFGSFLVKEPCECIINIEGHSSSYLNKYKLELYKDVDESYFWLGAIYAFSIGLTILIGWVYIPVKLINVFWRWLFNRKNYFYNK